MGLHTAVRGCVAVAAAVVLVVVPLGAVSVGSSAAGVEVTLVHAFASVAREDGGPGGPEVDVYLDGTLAASGLGFGEAVTVADRVAPGEYQVRLTQAGQGEVLQEQQVTIPRAESVDVAVGYSPAGGAGLPFVSVFVNDLRPTPADSTGLVLRNVADDAAVSLFLFGPPTPAGLTGVAKGEQGAADVQAGFTEMRLAPTSCAEECSVLLMEEFPVGVRTIVYAAGIPGNPQTGEFTFEASSFDAVTRALVVGEQPGPSPTMTPGPSPTAEPVPTSVPSGAAPSHTPVSPFLVGAAAVLALVGVLGWWRARREGA